MRPLAVVASLVLSACGPDDGPVPGRSDPPAVDARAPAVVSGAGLPPKTADCRSWVGLDLVSLPPLPSSEHTATFEAVWRTVLEKHYDPTLACLDWPALRVAFGEKVAGADSRTKAYEHINAMLDTLGQSHLRAVAPGDETSPRRESGPAVVPLLVRVLEGRAVVTDTLDGEPGPVPRGAILVAVAGSSVQEAIDGPLAAPGRDVERRLHAARAVAAMLHCPDGAEKTLRYLDPKRGDAETEATIRCVMPEATESLGNLRDVPVRVSSRMIDGTEVGYLAFNVWMVPLLPTRIRPALAELERRGMRALVLDLRGNPGGVGAMSIPMARELSTRKLDLGRLRMRDMTQEYKLEANPEAFAGPVVLLIDEGTASTSEIFAMGMRDAGRVRIVGASTSAGMALPSLMEELPDGGRLQYVVGDYTSPSGTVPEGEGVEPDLLVVETREDFARGSDPVLEAAVQLARRQMQGGE